MAKKRRLQTRAKLLFIFITLIAVLALGTVLLRNSIVLVGNQEVTVEVFSDYKEEGAYSRFNATLDYNSDVDTQKVGDYKVTYKWAIFSKSRIVHVVDTKSPVITLNNLYDEIHYLNSDYTPSGSYSCVDNYDGDLTDKVVVSGYDKIDNTKPSVYTITYSVEDSSGNDYIVQRKITFINDDFDYMMHIENSANVSSEMLQPIRDWFNLYYKAMHYVEYVDSTYLFDTSAKDYAYLNNMALQLLIDTRIRQDHYMALSDCKYALKVNNCKQNSDGTYTIQVVEDQYLDFVFLNGITSTCMNITNQFTIKKVADKYKLMIVNKPESFVQTFLRDYQKTADYQSYCDAIYQKYMQNYEEKNNQYLADKGLLNNGSVTYQSLVTKTADVAYNRQEALNYIHSYCLTRNSKYWSLKDTNCQNFASQVLVASGIPMDCKGSQQWKYFNTVVNEKDEEKGRSKSFVSIIFFLKYLDAERNEGIVAEKWLSLYYGEVGDLVYYQDLRDRYHHVVVVSQVVKDANGNVIDLLVSGNTTDMSDYPVSASTYFNRDVVKIIGYNN